jgi:hypothetical protein
MRLIITIALMACAVATAQPLCSLSSVVGTYAVNYESAYGLMGQKDSPVPTSYPGVFMGVFSIEASGNVKGFETVIFVGLASEYETVSGSIEIKDDCTGTMRRMVRLKGTNSTPFPLVERFIALANSADREIRTTILWPPAVGVPGAMGIGVWKRMSHQPNWARW